MIDSEVVVVDPESPIDAFIKEKDYESYHLNKVRFIPNVTLDGVKRAELKILYNLYKKVYQNLVDGVQNPHEDDILKMIF